MKKKLQELQEILSIQEKKSSKGTPFAIVKFSDQFGEFELFLFSEILIKNREFLKEGESFILTLFKDINNNKTQQRINVKKILSVNEMVNGDYKKISIELNNNYDLEELKNFLKEKGKTEVNLILKKNGEKLIFKLLNNRKFNMNLFNKVKSREYVKKITF